MPDQFSWQDKNTVNIIEIGMTFITPHNKRINNNCVLRAQSHKYQYSKVESFVGSTNRYTATQYLGNLASRLSWWPISSIFLLKEPESSRCFSPWGNSPSSPHGAESSDSSGSSWICPCSPRTRHQSSARRSSHQIQFGPDVWNVLYVRVVRVLSCMIWW